MVNIRILLYDIQNTADEHKRLKVKNEQIPDYSF